MKAHNLILLFAICLSVLGCTNPKKVFVNGANAKENVEKIKTELDSTTAYKFEEAYKYVLMMDAVGKKGDLQIIMDYSKKYEYLTLGDILDKVNSEEEYKEEE